MNDLPTFDEFRRRAIERGFDEVLERAGKADFVAATHTHAFDADVLVIRGEMWLGQDGVERRLLRGDTFQVPAGTPHTERYGHEGAVYWVARRSKGPTKAR